MKIHLDLAPGAVLTGGNPYAIGRFNRGRFHVRVVRFGKLAASYERRDGEQIHAVKLIVAAKASTPIAVAPRLDRFDDPSQGEMFVEFRDGTGAGGQTAPYLRSPK